MHNPTPAKVLEAIETIMHQVNNGYYVSSEDILRAKHAIRIVNDTIEKAQAGL